MSRSRIPLAFALSLLLGSCGGDGPTAPDVSVASVTVTGSQSVEVGKTVQLTAAALDAANKALAGVTFTWSSSNIAVATVSATGLVTGIANGSVSISARASEKTGSRDLTVIPAVASITIAGATSSQVGATTVLTATVKDPSGAVMNGVTITWTSSDPTVIAVDNGTVTATRIGSATVTAAAGSASATTSFTSSLSPYTFSFPAGTSPTDMRTIWDGVQYAHAYHQTIFARQIRDATTISALLTATGGCGQGGAAAFTGLHTVTFCLGNPGWLQNGPRFREKIVQHETFHLWQFEYRWLGNPTTAGATWVIEGSAELMGFKGIEVRSLMPFSQAQGCMIKQVADFAQQQPPGLPPLSSVESQQTFSTTMGPLYAQSMLAMEQLTAPGGLVSLKAYADAIAAGTPWQTAFQNSFGMTTSAFYSQFPAYRAAQPVPPQYQCGGA